MLIVVVRRHYIPFLPKGSEYGADLMHFVLARFELDDDPAAIVGVAFPSYEPGLLQPVEHPGDCPGRKPCEICELTSSRGTAALQDINDLHVRDGHPDLSRRRPEEGGAESIKLPELARKFPEDLRAFFL